MSLSMLSHGCVSFGRAFTVLLLLSLHSSLTHIQVFWACQGVYLAVNSTDENRGSRAGMFWSVYMSGAVPCSPPLSRRCWATLVPTSSSKCLASTRVRVTLAGTAPPQSSSSSLEVRLLPFCHLAVSIFGSVILFGLKPAVDENGNEKVIRCPRRNVKEEVASVLRMVVTPKMTLLVPLFLCLGFQSIFVNSMYNRQVQNTANISLFMIVYTIIEMFAGFIHGAAIDRLGLYPLLISYMILGSLSLVLAYYANLWQNWVFIPLYILFSLTDSGLQTLVAPFVRPNP